MSTIDGLADLFASRAWWVTMMVVIVVGAFLFPDRNLHEDDRNDKEKRD